MNWSTYHRRESQNTKNDQILSLHKSLAYLGSSLWFTLFWKSHKPTELVQTLTVTHKHRMQKAFPQVDWWITSSQYNWYSTIKTARYYLSRI